VRRPDRPPSALWTRLKKAAVHLAPTLTMAAILAVWEAACRLLHIPEFLLPPPTSILRAGLAMAPSEWLGHIGSTLRVALEGYTLSILISLPLATALALSPLLSRTIYPILVVIHSTPIVAVAPIIVVTLGVGDLPRVVITSIITFFPLVISTATGILSTPDELVELSRSLRATRGREILQIRLPYAIPYIFSALKVSITLAIIGAVVAEFVAAERGLGYSILFATSTFKIPQAFSCLAVLVMLSLTLFRIVVTVQSLLFPWSLPRDKER
jgi:NitT/TauT family transport system permease protein